MTEIQIDGTGFIIDGRPTYEGVTHNGKSIEGLLFNSRMVQAIFDDANPETTVHWQYPDTGEWDPDRNTDEFCAMLPEYRRHGLLGVTVGLQGGGSIYAPEVYDRYDNSAFEPDGTFRPAYFERLRRVLKAADAAGMVVIVNYFYWKQAARLEDGEVIRQVTASVTDWLLQTGYRNILVDVMNEVAVEWPERPVLSVSGVHELIEIVQQTTLNGRRLLVGASSRGEEHVPEGRWAEVEDLHLPHGNGCTAEQLGAKLRALKETEAYKRRPRPIVVNEDSPCLQKLAAAVDERCSWGFYCQGYGSQYEHDVVDWTEHGREVDFEALSGFQTVPVNWSINTEAKRAFFDRLAEVTQSRDASAGASKGRGESRPRVLILDTDTLTAELYRRELAADFSVKVCHAFDEALRLIKSTRIDLVVVEPMGLGGESWQLIAELHSSLQDSVLPVIICSTQDVDRETLQGGATAYLLKPITPAMLTSTIREYLLPPPSIE